MVGYLSQHYRTRQPSFEIQGWGKEEVLLLFKEGYTFEISIVVGREDLEKIEDAIRMYRKKATAQE